VRLAFGLQHTVVVGDVQTERLFVELFGRGDVVDGETAERVAVLEHRRLLVPGLYQRWPLMDVHVLTH